VFGVVVLAAPGESVFVFLVLRSTAKAVFFNILIPVL